MWTCIRKRDSLSQLVYRICEDNAVDQLMTYNFAGFADDVEDALSFKARNVDPRIRPSYSRILYSWYTLRGDYRNGRVHAFLARTGSDKLSSQRLSPCINAPENCETLWTVIPH